jgi:hypothetical protein
MSAITIAMATGAMAVHEIFIFFSLGTAIPC